jgi:translation initiation factor IF-2
MAKKRIYELAKKLKVENKDVLSALESMGITGKTHSSSLEDEIVRKVTEKIKKAAEPKQVPKAVHKVKKAPRPAEAAKPAKPEGIKTPVAKPKAAKTDTGAAAPSKAKISEKLAAETTKKAQQKKEQKIKQKKLKAEKKKFVSRPLGRPTITVGKQVHHKDLKDLAPEEPIADDIASAKVPDRFRKDLEAENVEKFKVKPTMQKAFQAIRKIDPAKKRLAGGFQKKRGRGGPAGQPSEVGKSQSSTVTAPRKKVLKIQEGATVKELAEIISLKTSEIIKKFMALGYMPNINQPVDMDAALLLADQLGINLEISSIENLAEVEAETEDPSLLKDRAPIVTIMGHVDHGKTSLLDAIREAKVADGEAGGITQHIGAYKVSLKGREIVFLDTPGHEAFTALRARGASVTDIVVLIVAADDGVKPQTVEAIDHAKAAGVPIIVAINKVDKPDANLDRVRTELSEHGILAEDWGGENIFAEISAKFRKGIENLLELILLQSDILELKANPDRHAVGVVIEAKLDKGRGPVATVLIQSGTLRIGDVFVSGTFTGKGKAMLNDVGKKIKEAGPATPVEVIGFDGVPNAGDTFVVMEDEKKARQVALTRLNKQKSAKIASKQKLTLDDLFMRIKEGEVKDLNIVIKGDVQGSVEALKESMEGITHPEVKVQVIHSAVGGINESDVMLASASNAIIIGFNVRPEAKASVTAEREGIDIELYNVIYEAIDDVKKALEGMLKPTIKENILGHAEVREVFHASKIGTIAGCMVTDGNINRNSEGVRLIRDNIVVYEGKLGSLKRFKEDVKEVASGYECGIMIENFNDIKTGDIIENFALESIASRL